MELRTFIALELPEVHKEAILARLNTWSKVHKQGINWTKPENLHLTLLFIGDTHSGDVPGLQEAILGEVIKAGSFDLKCLGFELFPARAPRLLWAKLATEGKAIYDFAGNLNHAVRQLGYDPDAKALKLHVTVARIKQQQPVWLEQEFMGAPLAQDAAEYNTVTFYQSILKPEGPVYTPLRQYTLSNRNK